MLTVNQVKEIVGALKDPIIDVPLKESEGIVNVSIKDNINHVSVKVAMAQLGATTIRSSNGYSQSLKRKWCKYCGNCFEELPGEVVEIYRKR